MRFKHDFDTVSLVLQVLQSYVAFTKSPNTVNFFKTIHRSMLKISVKKTKLSKAITPLTFYLSMKGIVGKG